METMQNQEFDTLQATKTFLKFACMAFFPMLLVIVIAGISYQLISDAGAFFGGWWKAFFLEAGALALIAWRPTNWTKVLKGIALIIAFGLVVNAAGMHAAKPHLEDSGLATVDRMKLEALESSIEAHREAVAAVKGQPRNSAMRAGDLSEAIATRDAFLDSVEPDKTVVAENHMAAGTAILFRAALQAINWLLLHWLVSIISIKMGNDREKRIDVAPNPQPSEVKTSPEPEGKPLASAVKWDSETLKILSKIEQNGGQIKRLKLQQARIADTAGLDPRLNQLLEAGVIDQERNGRLTETIYRLRG